MNAKDYNRINELLSEFSSLTAAVEAAEAEIKTIQLAAAKELLPRHATAKFALASLEEAIRKIADEHYPSLFPDPDKRNHKTPFGELKYHKSTSLEVADEEKAILKIKVEHEKEASMLRRANIADNAARVQPSQLIRTREELNLEALAQLDDPTLALFGITRAQKDNFKIVPFAMKSDKLAKKPAKDKAP